jgi:hypothetical protein
MPVRVAIASAGLADLTVTAAFTMPVLRATARERYHGDHSKPGPWRTGADSGPSARRGAPARRRPCPSRPAPRASRAAPGRDVVQRQRRAGCLDGSAATTCNHGNSHLRHHRRTDRVVTVRQESRARRNGIRPADKWMAPLRRMNPRHCQQPGGGRLPIRTYVRRPTRPPLLYFPAVLAVRVFRISFLTSGAKRARTADLLHAMNHSGIL